MSWALALCALPGLCRHDPKACPDAPLANLAALFQHVVNVEGRIKLRLRLAQPLPQPPHLGDQPRSVAHGGCVGGRHP